MISWQSTWRRTLGKIVKVLKSRSTGIRTAISSASMICEPLRSKPTKPRKMMKIEDLGSASQTGEVSTGTTIPSPLKLTVVDAIDFKDCLATALAVAP